jgi:protein LSM14
MTDNLTRKINEMRVDEQSRRGNHMAPGMGPRGAPRARGRGRGGREGGRPVAIPTTDFDFESANRKFNKEELAKEANAGDATHANGSAPMEAAAIAANGGPTAASDDEVVIPSQQPGAYDKKKSFFDDISSELKDREAKKTFGGPEFRHEERRRNIETFGQGSVDGYRGGGRGRGGRGGGGRGPRGGFRGPRGGFGIAGGPPARGRGGPAAVDDVGS